MEYLLDVISPTRDAEAKATRALDKFNLDGFFDWRWWARYNHLHSCLVAEQGPDGLVVCDLKHIQAVDLNELQLQAFNKNHVQNRSYPIPDEESFIGVSHATFNDMCDVDRGVLILHK